MLASGPRAYPPAPPDIATAFEELLGRHLFAGHTKGTTMSDPTEDPFRGLFAPNPYEAAWRTGWRYRAPKSDIEELIEQLKGQRSSKTPELPVLPIFEKSEQSIDQARYELLAQMVNTKLLEEHFRSLFLEPGRLTWSIQLDTAGRETLSAYVSWFASFDDLYRQLLTLQVADYFLARWIRHVEPAVRPDHQLTLVTLTKSSPTKAILEGADSGLKAVGEALSLGDQYQKFRTAGAKAKEAKAAADKAELEVTALRRENAKADAVAQADLAVELERKQFELFDLRRKQEETELNLRKLRRIDFDETLSLLQKHAPILDQLPVEMRVQIQAALTKPLTVLRESALFVSESRQLPPAQEEHSNTNEPPQVLPT